MYVYFLVLAPVYLKASQIAVKGNHLASMRSMNRSLVKGYSERSDITGGFIYMMLYRVVRRVRIEYRVHKDIGTFHRLVYYLSCIKRAEVARLALLTLNE